MALVDLQASGHHVAYISLFSCALVEHGIRVVALTPAATRVREQCQNEFVITGAISDPALISGRVGRRLHLLKRWNAVARQLNGRNDIDLVFFAYLDDFLLSLVPKAAVAALFRRRWSGLYFHPRHLREPEPPQGATKLWNPDYLLSSARCRSIAVLDETVARILQARTGKPVTVFPDVADDSPPSHDMTLVGEIRDRASGRKVVMLLGIERRKGVLTLIDAARRMQDHFFVFAGALHEHTFSSGELTIVRSEAAVGRHNCLFHMTRLQSEADVNAVVMASDVIFAAYVGFRHSSNMLGKAALFSKPVIVSDNYCMAERVRKYHLGEVVAEGSTDQVMDAIHRATTSPDPCALEGRTAYLHRHSYHALRDAFSLILNTV